MKYFKRLVKNIMRFYNILLIVFLINSCSEKETPIVIETGSVTDIDGNIYKTVKIGNQWWMSENLKVKQYNNGDSILNIATKGFYSYFDTARWRSIKDTGAYCIINDVNQGNYYEKRFGLLYNGYSVIDSRKIAPEGWHIPTDEEWKELEMHIGMSEAEADKSNWRGSNEGTKMKIKTNFDENVYIPDTDQSWKNEFQLDKVDTWGTNESGFAARGGSCKFYKGTDGNPGVLKSGFWWSSTPENNNIWFRNLEDDKTNVFRFHGSKNYGMSIRCVKD